MPTAARLCALGLVFGLLASAAERPRVVADDTTGASAPAPVISARDRLYAELSADVAELEQRGRIGLVLTAIVILVALCLPFALSLLFN